MNTLLTKLDHVWITLTLRLPRTPGPTASKSLSSPLRGLSKWSWSVESDTHGAPVDTARNSLSATELTSSKPKDCLRYVSSQKKTPRFGCVDANTPTIHLTAMAHTSRTSLYLPHYMNQLNLKIRFLQ